VIRFNKLGDIKENNLLQTELIVTALEFFTASLLLNSILHGEKYAQKCGKTISDTDQSKNAGKKI